MGGGRPAFVHPTAIVEEDVTIGSGTSVWDHAHLRRGAVVGRDCIVGGKSYVAGGVTIGDRVKINSFVYLCAGVTLEDGVMVSAGTIFTNDRTPRATTPDLARLRPSEPDEHTRATRVREGATLGAGCIVGSGLEIGRFAMVGMGSLVTRSIPDFHLAVGRPAASAGAVCRCGEIVLRFADGGDQPAARCGACGRRYAIAAGRVREEGDAR